MSFVKAEEVIYSTHQKKTRGSKSVCGDIGTIFKHNLQKNHVWPENSSAGQINASRLGFFKT